MATHYQPPDPRKSRLPAILLGALTTLVIFVTLSLTKILAEFEKEKDLVEAPSVAPPPPPEPVEEEPPPPEPEPEELPEMEQPEPRQLSLAQLDIALNTGPGSLAGDFTMPDIDANQDALGSTDLFSLDALDQRPRPISRPSPIYPPELQRRGISGRVKVYFVINEQGKVTTAEIRESTHSGFNQAALNAVKKWTFEPGVKDGQKVKTKAVVPIPFYVENA